MVAHLHDILYGGWWIPKRLRLVLKEEMQHGGSLFSLHANHSTWKNIHEARVTPCGLRIRQRNVATMRCVRIRPLDVLSRDALSHVRDPNVVFVSMRRHVQQRSPGNLKSTRPRAILPSRSLPSCHFSRQHPLHWMKRLRNAVRTKIIEIKHVLGFPAKHVLEKMVTCVLLKSTQNLHKRKGKEKKKRKEKNLRFLHFNPFRRRIPAITDPVVGHHHL